MKFLGGVAGGRQQLRAERAHSPCSLQPHEEGGGESIRKGRSGPAPDDTAAALVNGDEPMSANHGDPEAEIPFADDDDGEDVEAPVTPPSPPLTDEDQNGVPQEEEEEEEEESRQIPSTDTQGQVSEDSQENVGEEEESSSPTSSSDEDSQRRPVPGGAETEMEEEEPVAARSIVRCKGSSRTRRRRAKIEEPPLGILKGTSGRVTRRRVTFNEMMTVFMDGCPEVQVPAFRPWDLTFSEVCYMYEPPPEYRDWEGAFEPPDGYRDLDGVTTFDEASCSGSSDDDRGPVPPDRSQDAEMHFPMEDEDLSSGEFVVHRVTLVETEPEMVQLNDSSDQEDELVDEPEPESPVEEVTPCVLEEVVIPEDETDLDEETTLEGEDPLAESEADEVRDYSRAEEESAVTTPEELESYSEPLSVSEPDCTAEAHDEADDEGDKTTEEEEEDSTKVSRTNSQIRRSLELSALRRSLLRGETELLTARRRRQVVSRPKSPSSSGIEEKLRWLTSTEDLTTVGAPMSPPRGPAGHIQNGPTRWTSEQIYPPPPYGSHTCGPPLPPNPGHPQQTQQQQHELPYYRPPSRPSSFDPHVGLIAWEGYLQQRDRTRAAYQRHVERHPNAADKPPPNQPPRRPSNNSDELEWFVQRDSERTERIKKRYSLSEEEDPTFGFGRRPSVRGIRPRFGSTTEILQQLQSQLHKRPPPPPNCLLQYSSLPRNVSNGGPGGPFLPYPDLVARLPKVREEPGKRRAGEPVSIVRTGGRSPDPSAGPNQKNFVNKDERGAPEGASSSPKMSTDSLFAGGNSQPPKEDVVVYYSLRV